jgi:hypothetical protein
MAIFGIVFWLFGIAIVLWSVNALSVLRDQVNDVIARFERIEKAQAVTVSRRTP